MTDAPATSIPDAIDVEQVQTQAKRTFKLGERLDQTITRRSKTKPFFLDLNRVDAYSEAKTEVDQLKNQLKLNLDDAQRARLTKRLNEVEPTLEGLRASMLEAALAITVVALPEPVMARVRRIAKTRATADDGTVDADNQGSLFQDELAARAIIKIVDSSGAEAEMIPVQENGATVLRADVPALRNALDGIEWNRLDQLIGQLQFENAVAQAATDEPGF